jgi:hypothetical protein
VLSPSSTGVPLTLPIMSPNLGSDNLNVFRAERDKPPSQSMSRGVDRLDTM